jgi:DNA polymerase IV (DinB-like DNA polymerase)
MATAPAWAEGVPVVGHIDCDAMFAAIECLLNPQLAGQPVIVGADPAGGHGRGVVSTASYAARAFGVRSAMPISEAYRRCPHGIFLPVRHHIYREYGDRVMALLRETTSTLQRMSIDECYVDWTPHGAGAVAVAEGVRERVRREIGLTISVGIAANRLVAKIASDLRKPDALVVCPPGE